MPSRSRLAITTFVIGVLALLAPAAAAAAVQGERIVLKDGLTMEQQFVYRPDHRPHVVAFDARNVPAIRSRGAGEDDTSFVQRLEGAAWIRHDMLKALRIAYPDFAAGISASSAAPAGASATDPKSGGS